MIARNGGIPETAIAFSRQLMLLAEHWGEEAALVEIGCDGEERSLSRRELFEAVEKVVSRLHCCGVSEGDYVVVALPNCLEHVIVTIASWQLGACCVFISPKDTAAERNDVLKLFDCKMLVADGVTPPVNRVVSRRTVQAWATDEFPSDIEKLPFCAVAPARAVATGGSSGKPKIVVQGIRPAYCGADLKAWTSMTGQLPWERQLVPGTLFHNLYSNALYLGLFFGQTVYLMERFNTSQALELVERHAIQCVGLVPTMMERMMSDSSFATRDLSSLEAVFHSGGLCPDRVKLGWIERIGSKKLFEMYAATEMVGSTVIRGDEWLGHRGSVGRPVDCLIEIRGEDGHALPAGSVGEIYGCPETGLVTHYLGSPPICGAGDGFFSVGDLGWLDEDGYLYISDRRPDMIVTGGKNVYANEVENAMLDYPGIRDAVVIGMPDEEWGLRIHAILEISEPGSFSFEDLKAFLHERMSGYKCPKTFEVLERMPRTDFGKIRRKELIEERTAGLSEHVSSAERS